MSPTATDNLPENLPEEVGEACDSPKRGLKAKLRWLTPLLPLSGLIVVVAVMAISTKGLSVSALNLKLLVNQFATLAVVATCSSFIFSMGGFDISIGAVTCLSAVVGAAALNAGASAPLVLVVCLATGVGVSLFSASCISLFKLPSFLVTLAVYLSLSSAVALIMKGEERWTLREHYTYLDTNQVKLAVVFGVVLLAGVIFNFMKMGRENRLIGGSQTVARYTGMSNVRNTMLSFLISGIGIGIAAFMLMGRAGSVSYQTGQSYGFDVIIAIVLGGMPISGGARSRITAGLVGALTLTAFNNGLVILGASVGVLQVTRGALFLLVVSALMARHRERLLAK